MTPVSRDEFEALKSSHRAEVDALKAAHLAEAEGLKTEISAIRRRLEGVELLHPVVTSHGGRLEMLESEYARMRTEVAEIRSALGSVCITVDRLLTATTTQGLVMERVDKTLLSLASHFRVGA